MIEKKYYKKLDYIRIISCFLVLFYHLNIIKSGYLAVCTFFVLSGYLSCLSLLKNKSIKSFYVSRLKKLYLPLLLVVFLTVIIAKCFSVNWLNLKQETLSVIFGYNNFWQINANLDYFANHVNSPFIHLWYISILMQFDFVFPIIFSLIKKFKRTIFIVLTIIFTLIFCYMSKNYDITLVYYNTLARVFSLLFGVILALNNNTNTKFDKPLFFLYLCLLIIICFIPSTKYYALLMILTTIISTRLVKYATKNSEKSNNIISFLSKSTYMMYLVQYPVIYFMKGNTILIIILTLIISFILYLFMSNFKNKIFKIVFIIILLIGNIILITEKNHSSEMKKLEKKLNDNLKIIEQKNNDYQNTVKEEEQSWNKVLEDMENEESSISNVVSNLPVVGIGDSVLLGTVNELYKKFPNGYFDGKVSRSIPGSYDLLNDLKNSGKLSNIVILSLANNGDYSERRNNELMSILGDRQIYWVDAVGADDPTFNQKFRTYASNYSNIHIVKWEEASKNHPEYFYADGIHLKDDGAKAYANLIFDAIYNDYLNEYKNKKDEVIKNHENESKNKIVFYGNDALNSSFKNLHNLFEKANFNVLDYSFDSLYDELKNKIEKNHLEYKIVLLFDFKIKKSDYKKIIELCKNHEIYICNISEKKYEIDGATVINFYDEIKKHDDYLMNDKKHLSEKGSKKLSKIIYENIEERKK